MSVLELSPAKLSQSADDGAMFHPNTFLKQCGTTVFFLHVVDRGMNNDFPKCPVKKKTRDATSASCARPLTSWQYSTCANFLVMGQAKL